jgi:Na+-transporting methylmalonyl-CoA/oxaloacetate decarboxylase gamma subunit
MCCSVEGSWKNWVVNFLVIFVLIIRMAGDGEGRAPADDASSENKEPSEEKSAVVNNRENTSTPVADTATAVAHKEEKKEPQATIKTLMPVIRSPSHAQEIPATERSAFPSVSYFILFESLKESIIPVLFRIESLSQLDFGNLVLHCLGCNRPQEARPAEVVQIGY